MTPFEFILGSLATHRLSLLVSKESGPMRMFRKLRNLPKPRSAAREGLSCTLCNSVWWSGIACGYFVFTGDMTWLESPLYWLAMSSVAVLLHMQWTTEI